MSETAAYAPILAGHRRRQRRGVATVGGLGLAAILCVFADTLTGPSALGPWATFTGLLEPGTLTEIERVILIDLRLPAALLAALVGMALALSGAEMQTVLENPLASPFTLGISSAAAFGAALAIVTGIGLPFVPPGWLVPANAFLFALLSVCLLQTLTRFGGGGPETLVLFGIALVFSFNALLSLTQLYASAQGVQQIVFWTMGSLDRAGWTEVTGLAAALALLAPTAFAAASRMTALRFGAERAQSFGVDVTRLRTISLIRISFLTGIAVALTGTIAFVGLVGPHVARLLVGEDHRVFLPAAALTGSILMSGAAIASKLLIPGVAVPLGIVTAIVGVPVFVALILSRGKVS